jgi:hypothetical protein
MHVYSRLWFANTCGKIAVETPLIQHRKCTHPSVRPSAAAAIVGKAVAVVPPHSFLLLREKAFVAKNIAVSLCTATLVGNGVEVVNSN